MKNLTQKDVKNLITGSVYFATGGGLRKRGNETLYQEIFKRTRSIELRGIDEFSENSFLATIYGVGNPAKVKGKLSRIIVPLIENFKKYFDLEISGLIPGEIGSEATVFYAASVLDLPVVDSDLVGGRAAPEIQMDVFTLFGLPLTPMLARDVLSREIAFTGNWNTLSIEKTLRNFFEDSDSAGLLAGYAVKAGTYRKIGAKGTITSSLETGRALNHGNLEKALAASKARVIGSGILKKPELGNLEGFQKGLLRIGDFEIAVKNENMSLKKNGKLIAAVPELIILLDKKSLSPLHNADIGRFAGREIIVISAEPQPYWKTKQGLELFGGHG